MASKRVVGALAILAALSFTGCSAPSDAEVASQNVSIAADNFEVNRRIVGINGITDQVLFLVEGRCSIFRDGDLVIICKQGPNEYKKHYLGLSQNVTYVSTQLEAVDVSVYRTRIILKPESLIGVDFDMSVGVQ